MQTRKLGSSDFEITRVGLGAWAMGGGDWKFGWGKQEDKISIRTIHKALEMGVNWIDTAAVYGHGHSEEVVGKALKQTSYKPYVFSKCSRILDAEGNLMSSLKRASVIREVENSLRRLQLDVIDLMQIHWPRPDEDIEEGVQTLADLQQAGKIRHVGVSNFSVEHMKRAQEIAPVTSNQPPYSLIFPGVEDEILPYCLAQNIGVIHYSPMASGLLSGKMSKERMEILDPADWRTRADHFKEPRLSRNLALADVLKKIGPRHDATAGEIAIAWTLLNPAVTGAIVGMRRPEQVEGVIHAGEIALSESDVTQITDFVAANP